MFSFIYTDLSMFIKFTKLIFVHAHTLGQNAGPHRAKLVYKYILKCYAYMYFGKHNWSKRHWNYYYCDYYLFYYILFFLKVAAILIGLAGHNSTSRV